MADIGRHLLESSAATTGSADEEEEDDDAESFTFAAASPVLAAGESFPEDGPAVYPVFGRPRHDHSASAAAVRVPLAQLLQEERGSSSPGQQPDELDGVPAATYCLWSPRGSDQSPARCQKSGSTGSVPRWRQRLLGRGSSDGKGKFVYILQNTAVKEGDGGDGGRRPSSSLSRTASKEDDLLGLFANAGAFRRSYHPF
jgi:hypothetical protein